MVPHLKRPIDILFSVLKIVSDVNVTGRLYSTKRKDLKWRVVMGIIVNPFRKKLPHPQDGSSTVDVLNPRARKQECSSWEIWNPPRILWLAVFPHQTAWEWGYWVRYSAKYTLMHDGVTLQWTNCCIFVEWSLTHKAKEVRGYVNSASSPPNSRIMPFV